MDVLVLTLIAVSLLFIMAALDNEERSRKLALWGAVLVALSLAACDKEPVAPTPVVVAPTPSPTPVPVTSVESCEQANLALEVLNGAGNPDFLFDYREYLDARASPRNRAGAVLPNTCDFIRVVGWQCLGAGCQQYGDLTGFATIFKVVEPGTITIIATHGQWKAIWNGRLIRNHAGALVISGSATHTYRQVAGQWEVIQ